MDKQARFLGAVFGLAYGDAVSFPALFHRFEAPAIPRRRHNFLWRQNSELDEMHISRVMLPFTHRIEAEHLEIYPTDDTEFALLTLKALLKAEGEPTPETFSNIWQTHVVPAGDEIRSSFSERSAIENFKHGLLPPATGNDNPLHYEDCAVSRAVPVGLYCVGNPQKAVQVAEWDAQITQAEDGIYAALGMAAAIAILADGGSLDDAVSRARQELPQGSWIAHVDKIAQQCLQQIQTPEDLTILLTARVINSVYSYGNAAPETFSAALTIVQACGGDFHRAVSVANSITKSADSLPAMVGGLCGAYQGVQVISPIWKQALAQVRGVCLPFLKDESLETLTLQLLEKSQR